VQSVAVDVAEPFLGTKGSASGEFRDGSALAMVPPETGAPARRGASESSYTRVEGSGDVDEWLLFGHILGAFVLLAATGLTTGAAIAAGRARHAVTVVTLLDLQLWSERVVTSVGAALVLLFGTLLVNEAGHDFGEPWISAAYALLIGALAVDHAVYLRHVRRVRDEAAALGESTVTEELRRKLRAPFPTAVGVLLSAAWLVALWLMVAKPGG
jgi:uncharacterized membrane protein